MTTINISENLIRQIEMGIREGVVLNMSIFRKNVRSVLVKEFNRKTESDSLNAGVNEVGVKVGSDWSTRAYSQDRDYVVDILGNETPSFAINTNGRSIEGRLGHLDAGNKKTTFRWRRVDKNDKVFSFAVAGAKPSVRGSRSSRSYVGAELSTEPGFVTSEATVGGLIGAVEYGGTWVVKPRSDRDLLMPEVRPVKLEKEITKTVKPVRPYLRTMNDNKVVGNFVAAVKKRVAKRFKNRTVK